MHLYALQALALRASVLVLQVRLTLIVNGKLYMYLAYHLDHIRLLYSGLKPPGSFYVCGFSFRSLE